MRFFLVISFFAILPLFGISQSVSFTYQSNNGNFCIPATITFNPTTSQPPIGYTWTFGNGQQSNSTNPTIVYSNAGTFIVKLVVVFANQAIETSQNITINPSVTSLLAANRNNLCQPGTVNFTASSSGNISSYNWSFGDGTSITSNAPIISHVYTSYGSFPATVTVTDVSGCLATSSAQLINIERPTITGTVNPVQGCVPISTSFSAIVDLPPGEFVSSYSWNFGDGSPNSSSGTHLYTSAGNYFPTVSIISNNGCTNSYSYTQVNFGTSPIITTAYPSKFVHCASEIAQFVAKSPTATAYKWDFGDGLSDSIPDTLINHRYRTLGVKNVRVTPYIGGCAGPSVGFSINIIGVVAEFNFSNSCTNKKRFSFTNTSIGNISSSTWNFGDGSPDVNALNAVHVFPPFGLFNTTLIVSDNVSGCADTLSSGIITGTPQLINSDTFLCRKTYTTFTIQNNYPTTGSLYTWNVLGLTPPILTSVPILDTSANIFGNFTNNYVVIRNGAAYCPDTSYLNHPISVRGPVVDFDVPGVVCSVTNFNVINNSVPYTISDTVRTWLWNFGNAPITQTVYQPNPIQTPVQLSDFINYPIKLIAIDKNGCTDSLEKIITAKLTPFLRIFPRNTNLCLGEKDSLIAFYSDTLRWLSPVSCNTCDTVSIMPTNTSYIIATATNNLGCVARDSTFAFVTLPFTTSVVSNPTAVCLGDTIKLTALPLGKKISWLPTTNISNTNTYSPIVYPIVTTKYSVAIEDSLGCFKDTAYVDAIIKTLPKVNAGPDRSYPYFTTFSISPVYSSNIAFYTWSPIGTLSCTNCPIPTGIADQIRTYSIKAMTDSGCVASDVIRISISCENANILLPTAFSPNRDGKNDIFKPITRGIKMVSKFVIFNRYGQKLFEAKDFNPILKPLGWDGKVNGEDQPPHSYVYFITAICDTGEVIEKKDSFVIIR